MISNFIFPIILLLLVNLAPAAFSISPWVVSIKEGFLWGLGTYCLCLALIVFQARWNRKNHILSFGLLQILINIELLITLTLFHFFFTAHRFFLSFPFLSHSQFFLSLYTIALYGFGLWLFHYAASKKRDEANRQLWILLPFLLPFLLFNLLIDSAFLIPNDTLQSLLRGDNESITANLLLLGVSLAFLLICLLLLPYLVKRVWQCVPLQDSSLNQKLEEVCKRAQFQHGGMLVWTVMNPALTAAIIGILPRLRYILFTQTLIERLPTEEVEAILAHEIGHSKHKHLLIYPLILLGMLVMGELFMAYASPHLFYFLTENGLEKAFIPLGIFLPYALIVAFYVRFIFGYFSRLFERQADLYVFALSMPASYLIAALNDVAIASGNTHNRPSWHHYSIQQRIDFLEKAACDPGVIQKHTQKIFWSLLFYFLLLTLSVYFLF